MIIKKENTKLFRQYDSRIYTYRIDLVYMCVYIHLYRKKPRRKEMFITEYCRLLRFTFVYLIFIFKAFK